MKVLLVNSLYHPNMIGGAERSVQFLAEALLQKGHRPVVVTTSPRGTSRVEEVNGVKVHYVGLRNVYWPFSGQPNPTLLKPFWHLLDTDNPWMVRAVERIVDAEQPDVVHTNSLAGFSVQIWQAVKRRRRPLVHSIWDYYLLCPRSSMFHRGKNCAAPCLTCRPFAGPRRRLSQKVDAVIAISQFMLDRHLQFGYFRDTPLRRIIYNPQRRTTALVRARPERTATGRLRLGFLGRLHPTKGLDRLLSALQGLPAEGLELHVAGKGTTEYENQLRHDYPLPNVQYLGFAKPEELFSRIDVLVVPSVWHEPLPRTVFEAYAHGVPVLGAQRGGIPEIIEPERTGLLFDPDQPETLQRGIQQFQRNPDLIRKMGERALAKAQEFLPERIVAEHEQVYDAVRGGKPS